MWRLEQGTPDLTDICVFFLLVSMMPNGAEVIDSVLMKMEYVFIFYPGKSVYLIHVQKLWIYAVE